MQTDKLCVYTGLFLWGNVCVFQLWTVDYQKQHEPVSVSLFLFSSREELKTLTNPNPNQP